ncbi:MAG: Hsp20/alpha crystallin family protein [Bdellovibrionales bacterium]
MRSIVPFYTNRGVTNAFKDMDDFFEAWTRVPATQKWEPVTHFDELEDHFSLSLDIPGIKKNELKLEVTGQMLSISGESQRDKMTRTFKRSFTLPETVDVTKIEAKFEDGVLDLKLPKMEAAKSRLIEIQ